MENGCVETSIDDFAKRAVLVCCKDSTLERNTSASDKEASHSAARKAHDLSGREPVSDKAENSLLRNETFTSVKAALTMKSKVRSGTSFFIASYGVFVSSHESNISMPSTITAKFQHKYLKSIRKPFTITVGYITLDASPPARTKQKDETVTASRLLPRFPYLVGAVHKGHEAAPLQRENINFSYDLSLDNSLEDFSNATVNRIWHRCARQSETKRGAWTRKGCITTHNSFTSVRCSCNGSTIFGIKQFVRIGTKREKLKSLLVAVPILLTVSCIFLLASAILLFVYRRSLKSKRTFVQIGVALAFLGQTAASIFSNSQYYLTPTPTALCESIVFIYLYFRITASWWVLNEGIILLLKFAFPGYLKHREALSSRRMLIVILCTWLIPAAVFGCIIPIELQLRRLIGLSPLYIAAEKRNDAIIMNYPNASLHQLEVYPKYIKCSPLPDSVAYNVGLASLITTLSLNTIICFYAVWVMCRWVERHSDAKNKKVKQARIKSALIGVGTLTWCLGLPHLLVLIMRKTHAVTNLHLRFIIPKLLIFLEGPLLFYFYCWRNEKLRKKIRLSITRFQQRKL